MKQFEVPVTYCPKCKKKLDGATSFYGQKPVPGDVTICLYCLSVLTFGKDMKMVYLTEEEIKKLPPPLLRGIEEVKYSIRVTEGQNRKCQSG